MKPVAEYATIQLLAEAWPDCFSVAVAGRRPLKVGIDRDVLAAAEGAITPAELTAAFRVYTRHKRYLRTLRVGAQRIGLDGCPAGEVTAEQAARARRHIERIEQRHSDRVRAWGLAKEEAALKAKAEAEAAERAAEDAKRKAEGRKPVLRLPQSATASAAA